MLLYLLLRDESACGWDEVLGFVIAAISPAAARKIASEHPGDEGAEAWTDAAQSSCTTIGRAGPRVKLGVVLSSYKAG